MRGKASTISEHPNSALQVAFIYAGTVAANWLSITDRTEHVSGLVVHWPEHKVPEIIQESGSYVGLAATNNSVTTSDGAGPHYGTICLMESHTSEPVTGTQTVQLGCGLLNCSSDDKFAYCLQAPVEVVVASTCPLGDLPLLLPFRVVNEVAFPCIQKRRD